MAIRRNKNTGEPIKEPSEKIGLDKETRRLGGMEEKSTVRRATVGHAGRESPSSGDEFSPFEAVTRKVGAGQHQKGDAERTRLLRRSSETVERTDKDQMADPIVGWLVVIAGPGTGQVCRLGYGSNSLGRGDYCRVRLDFGDNQISREEHATVTYDSRGRKFYLQHGGGKNLTYLNDDPVLVPTVLEAMMDFSIGDTTLRFIPFCGPEFDWEDLEVE